MPFVVTCPHCSTKLKTPQAVPAGRSVTCPQCKAIFTLTEPAMEIASQSPETKANPKPAAPPPPAKPARSVSSVLANLPSKKEEIPAAEMLDDEPPRSKRRRDEEDDDRPRSRRGRDDEEDDRPSRRRDPSNRDEDEDDRPRPKRASARNVEDDEDEDVRPSRRRSRPGGGKKRRTGLILGLVGGGAFLMLLVAGALFYIFDPFRMFGGPSSDMLAWAPSDSQSITVVDMEEAQLGAGMLGSDRNGQASRIGLRPDEIESTLSAGREGGPFGVNPDVVVFKLKSAADQARITSAVGGTESTSNGATYFRTRDGGAVHFPSNRIVVHARSEATMTVLLAKGRGKVVVDDKLRSALASVDGTIVTASIGEASRNFDPIGMMAGMGNMAMNLGGPPPFGRNPFDGKTSLNARAVSVATGARVSGANATVRYQTTYDSTDSATRVAEGLRSFMSSQQVRNGGDTSYTVSQSGATVSLTLRGPSGRVNGSLMPGR